MLQGNVKKNLEFLKTKRNKFYDQAHLRIFTNEKSLAKICDEIMCGIL